MNKKLCTLGVLGLSTILLTGCGNGSDNTLYCTDTEDRMTEELTYTFKNDNVSSVKAVLTSVQDSAEDAKENKSAMITLMDLAYGSSSTSNYTYEVTTKGKKIILTMDVDYEKASDSLKEKLGTGSKKEVKEFMEGNGSTCK